MGKNLFLWSKQFLIFVYFRLYDFKLINILTIIDDIKSLNITWRHEYQTQKELCIVDIST